MKYLSSFPIAHAAVLALVMGVFLVDGCMNRPDRRDTPTTPTVFSAPVRAAASPALAEVRLLEKRRE